MQASGSAAIAPKVASQSDNKPSSTSPPVGTVQIKAVKPHVEKAIDKAAGKLKAVPEVSIAPETAIGTLTLDSTPPCNIYIDGKSLRLRTPQPAIQLPAGRHQIMLVNAEFKITDSFLVEIKPGLIEKAFKHYEPKTDSATTINPWGVDLILSSVEEIRNAA